MVYVVVGLKTILYNKIIITLFVKDYEKSKMHLSRGMAAGNFICALQLIKVECLLQQVDTFPIVQALNKMYDFFQSPNKRLIVLCQILIYYFYNENNPREIMRFLKLYLDQNVDDALKKYYLIVSK